MQCYTHLYGSTVRMFNQVSYLMRPFQFHRLPQEDPAASGQGVRCRSGQTVLVGGDWNMTFLIDLFNWEYHDPNFFELVLFSGVDFTTNQMI